MPSTITFTLSTLKSSAIVFYNGQIPGNCTSIDPSKQMEFPQWQQSSYSRLSRKFHSEQALYNNCYGHEYNVKSNIRVQNLWKLAKSKSYPIMIWIWMLLLSYSMDKSISGSHNSAHASLIGICRIITSCLKPTNISMHVFAAISLPHICRPVGSMETTNRGNQIPFTWVNCCNMKSMWKAWSALLLQPPTKSSGSAT